MKAIPSTPFDSYSFQANSSMTLSQVEFGALLNQASVLNQLAISRSFECVESMSLSQTS